MSPGPPTESAHEQRLHDEGRRGELGAWYTPAAVVEGLLDLALDPLLAERAGDPAALAALRVVDPACGDGRFLVATARRMVSALVAGGCSTSDAWTAAARSVAGVDLDPDAVALARANLEQAVAAGGGTLPGRDRVVVGDALDLDAPPWDPGLDTRGAVRHQGPCWVDLLDAGASGARPTGFDLVVGNPPFKGQLKAVRTTAREQDARRRRFAKLSGPFTDPAAFFLLLATELARTGSGVVALVLPVPLLATRDGGAIRRHVLSRSDLQDLWIADERVFRAGVEVCAPVLRRRATEAIPAYPPRDEAGPRTRRGAPTDRHEGERTAPRHRSGGRLVEVATGESGPSRRPVRLWSGLGFEPRAEARSPTIESGTWSSLLATHLGVPDRTLAVDGRLDDLATATSDFRDQYYGLAGQVVDQLDATAGRVEPPLVSAGTIDPAHVRWGETSLRFQKVTYLHPRVRCVELDDAMQGWVRSKLVPKVVVGTQTQVLEAVVDLQGVLLPSVPLVTIQPRRAGPEDLHRIGALLTSPVATMVAMRRHAGSGMGAQSLRVGPREMVDLPLPADRARWDAAAASFRAATEAPDAGTRHAAIVACGRAMNEAFGLGPDPELLHWWTQRLPTRHRRR